MDVEALLAGGTTVRRRVCAAGARTTVVELEDRDVALPLALVPPARDGQWLVFVRRGERVEVRVDLKATLEGELRFAELMALMLGPSRPHARAS